MGSWSDIFASFDSSGLENPSEIFKNNSSTMPFSWVDELYNEFPAGIQELPILQNFGLSEKELWYFYLLKFEATNHDGERNKVH